MNVHVATFIHNVRKSTSMIWALWTADRDFTRFPRLRTVNPLI